MLSNDWKGIDEIVLYGLGLVSERCIHKLIEDFKVSFIIDQNKKGTAYQGIPVLSYENVASLIKRENKKIVVITSQKVYVGIKKTLLKDGMVEFRDFCWVEQFVIDWYWENRKQVNIIQVNTAVTTFCTLNCEKCNVFMPYYKERKHYSYEEMKSDMDLLLKNIDYVFLYMFLGGEPFLNSQLYKIIEYAGETYSDRIGKLSITTNAMVMPDENTLQILSKYNVRIVISDYSLVTGYQDRFCKFLKTMKERKIPYTVNETLEWKDFGFPKRTFDWAGRGTANLENIRLHMAKCSPLFHGVNDGRFYYCQISWSAQKAGLFQNMEDDYIELGQLDPENMEDRRKLSRFSKGNIEKGYLELCRYCGGCGEDNQCYVPVGVQMEKD